MRLLTKLVEVFGELTVCRFCYISKCLDLLFGKNETGCLDSNKVSVSKEFDLNTIINYRRKVTVYRDMA